MLFQIGAALVISNRGRFITNWGRYFKSGQIYFKSGQLFQIGAEQLPEKEMRLHCSFIHTFEEKNFLSLQMQRRAPIIWVKFKFV